MFLIVVLVCLFCMVVVRLVNVFGKLVFKVIIVILVMFVFKLIIYFSKCLSCYRYREKMK